MCSHPLLNTVTRNRCYKLWLRGVGSGGNPTLIYESCNGRLAIALARSADLAGARILATDLEAARLCASVADAGLAGRIETRSLRWGSSAGEAFDLVLNLT